MPSTKDSKALSEERYAKFAQGYVNSPTHAKGYDLDRLVEIAQPQLHWDALDIATGGGHTALKFAPYVKSVVASDLTKNMLLAAETHILAQGVNNVRFQQADAEDLPFESASFDLVICRIAPHHFPNVIKFVQEAARVLKPGGLFVLQDHVLPEDEISARYVDAFEWKRDPSHNRAFSLSEWRGLLQNGGFTVLHEEQITKRHVLRPWAERQGHGTKMIADLTAMMNTAPEGAIAWMEPQDWGTDSASFVNHHILLKGKK